MPIPAKQCHQLLVSVCSKFPLCSRELATQSPSFHERHYIGDHQRTLGKYRDVCCQRRHRNSKAECQQPLKRRSEVTKQDYWCWRRQTSQGCEGEDDVRGFSARWASCRGKDDAALPRLADPDRLCEAKNPYTGPPPLFLLGEWAS